MLFACHMKSRGAYICYSSAHFDIQHWIAVSAESDVPAVLTPHRQPAAEVTLDSVKC